MSSENSSKTPDEAPDTVSLAKMYLQTLEFRMEPKQFHALQDAMHGLFHAMEDDGPSSFELDKSVFTDEMHREFLVVMAIVNTGHMNHRVVDMPAPDGGKGWAVVNADVAGDPAVLEELRERLQRMADNGHLQ